MTMFAVPDHTVESRYRARCLGCALVVDTSDGEERTEACRNHALSEGHGLTVWSFHCVSPPAPPEPGNIPGRLF